MVLGGSAGYKLLDGGYWGMVAGDANGNGQIEITDQNTIWKIQAGNSGYLESDFNLDGQSNNADKNETWYPNIGSGSQIPE
jgi:hypothetical protein